MRGLQHPAKSRGQAMVEFALLSGLLFLMVMGIFDFGRAISVYINIAEAAHEGARQLVLRVARQLAGGNPDLDVILQFTRSLEAGSLKLGRLPVTSGRVVDVAEVVEDPVGGSLVADAGVQLECAMAMFEGSIELAKRTGGHAERHVRIGDSEQALGVSRGVEGAKIVGHRLGVLAQSEAAAAQVGQNPGAKLGISMAATIQPVERSPARLD